jgi:Uncharacterized conserved protein
VKKTGCFFLFLFLSNKKITFESVYKTDVKTIYLHTKMKRYGSIIRVKSEKLDEYKLLHAAVWSGVLKKIHECNIRNYSIYYKDGFLFSYYEYIGSDYDADMAKMAADPETQRWWKETDPCQLPLDSRQTGEWWAEMEEVFHTD